MNDSRTLRDTSLDIVQTSPRTVLVSVALLVIPVGLYFLVLGGVAVLPQGSGVTLTAIAGVATLAAALHRATLPAITAGVAMVGFGLGATSSGFVVTVAAVLRYSGGLDSS